MYTHRNLLHTFLLAILLGGLQQHASALGFETANYPAGVSPNSVAVGDFNGDRKPDLAVADSCWDKRCTNDQPSAVVVALGRGDGTFRKGGKYPASISGSAFAVYVTAADLNGDGILDLVVVNDGSNAYGDLAILLGNGDGSFQGPVVYGLDGAVPVWAGVGDFNGDHIPDLAVVLTTNDKVDILLGVGDGTFRTAVPYDAERSPQALSIADFNRDGKLDIAVVNECGTDPACQKGSVSILLGKGDGTFRHGPSFPAGLEPLDLRVADFNGDRRPDVVVANPYGPDGQSQGTVGIVLGNGDGTFQPIVNYPTTGNATVRLTVGDLNGDSYSDVLALNYQVNGQINGSVTVLPGNGDGTLQAGTDYPVGYNPISAVIRNLNRDRAADFVAVNQSQDNLTVFINTAGSPD
jgi:VCBS repeat protein/FG-GAP repeat protein